MNSNKPKIAVYTICKNEEQFIEKWIESAKDADYLLVVDTGSTDKTGKLLSQYASKLKNFNYGHVVIKPWRFEDARNFSLQLLPDDIDICICLDMDEVLTEGWRKVVENAWNETKFDRLRYNYIWSWNKGKPGVTYLADKIHARHGYRWVHPVHEVALKDSRLGPEISKFVDDTLIEHYPDSTKSRSSYLPLLELSVREMPHNDRNAHYYARELMYNGQYEQAIVEFQRHLELPTATWKAERSASMRYIGDCYWSVGNYESAIAWFFKARLEDPSVREPLISLAQAHRALKQWDKVEVFCMQALAITEKSNSYITSDTAWNGWPEQMLAEAKEAVKMLPTLDGEAEIDVRATS